jgi:hypothetical protein
VSLPEIEQRLREHVGSIPPPARIEVLRILTIRGDAERARSASAQPAESRAAPLLA